jgi:hypothetical protein
MERFEKDHIAVVGVCFPGTHASQRDKPYLNEVIEQLHDERLDSSARIVPLPDGGGAPAPESDR